MSYTYGFFDAVDLGSGNYDRVYSSAEFSHYWALLVGDGVFGQPSTSLNVLATAPVAMRVKVAPGTGWIKGHYLTVPDNMDEVIAVPVANPSLPRIDSIIMALNNTDRDMKLYVRSGTAAASPKAVTLQRDADVWELELAQITVAAGAGNITQQAIKDMRTDPDRCGIVTGLIDQFDVSGFLTAAQASFDEWFKNVKGQLGDDVAGNLLNLINGLQASKADITYVDQKEEGLRTSIESLDFIKSPGNILVSNNLILELFPDDFVPCDGRKLSVSTYSKLFSVIGTKYGGTYPNCLASLGSAFPSSVQSYCNLMIPSNTNKIYVLSNNGDNYWTNDGGSTWISLSSIGNCIGADCNNDGTVFLKGYGSLQRTTSPESSSWSSLSVGLSGYYFPRIRFNPSNSKFYVLAYPSYSSSSPLYLLESTNSSGTSFKKYTVLSSAKGSIDNGVLAINGSNIIAGDDTDILYSTDYGRTFKPSNIPVSLGSNNYLLDSSEEGIWWAYTNGSIYRSEDFGANFTKLCTLSTTENSSIVAMDGFAIVTPGAASYLITLGGTIIPQTNPRGGAITCLRRKNGVPYLGTTKGIMIANQVSPSEFAVPNVTLDYGEAFIHI